MELVFPSQGSKGPWVQPGVSHSVFFLIPASGTAVLGGGLGPASSSLSTGRIASVGAKWSGRQRTLQEPTPAPPHSGFPPLQIAYQASWVLIPSQQSKKTEHFFKIIIAMPFFAHN